MIEEKSVRRKDIIVGLGAGLGVGIFVLVSVLLLLRPNEEPDPTAPGDEEIFEGLVYERCLKLGHGELYESPDDLPDSLKW